jgi:hypothetical protein
VAIKDSSETRIKAADAKAAMDEGPVASSVFCQELAQRAALKAVTVFSFNNGRRANQFTWGQSAADRGVLENWSSNTIERATQAILASRGAVILAIRDDGVIDLATWGEDATACLTTATWGQAMLGSLPVCPFQTWFGWGNGGVPRRINDARFRDLSEQQRVFVHHNTHPQAA